MYKRFFLTIIFLIAGCIQVIVANNYPTHYRVTTTLNVRSGPGTSYRKIGQFYRDNHVTVKSFTYNHSMQWGEIDYYGQTGYVAMRYLEPQEPDMQEERAAIQTNSNRGSSWASAGDFFGGIGKFLKYGFIILCAIIGLAFIKQIFQALIFIGMFMGAGALLFWILFDNSDLGATIGFVVAILIGLRLFLQSIDGNFFTLFFIIYWIVTIPSWICNRLQLALTGPWRYLFKYINVGDSTRNVLRPFLYFVQILLYIATTPLRVINAIYYDIFIYGITEIYDLVCEVFIPTNYSEGRGDFWKWILWFPVRLVKYPLFHGTLVLIEGAVWTVIDIIIPTITMYHGTNLEAANAIVGCSERNQNLWDKWHSGSFNASTSNNGWGGLGVYFAPSRRVVISYCHRANGTVFIACRVSLGKILNYSLAPRYVENNTGKYGCHSILNDYANANGYHTAEWWNGEYWEYCMFDWQNRYNYPWRIRPIYVFNISTGLAQHIEGGFRHWLFSKMVLEDILDNPKFTCLVVFAFIVVIYCCFQLPTLFGM